jgi:hypothetical protein
VDYKNSLCENVRGILRGRDAMTDNSAEGYLEPEMEVRAEEAEDDVKESLDFVVEENLQGEYFWTEFCTWFETPSFRRVMESAGKRLAGNLRSGLYNRGIKYQSRQSGLILGRTVRMFRCRNGTASEERAADG